MVVSKVHTVTTCPRASEIDEARTRNFENVRSSRTWHRETRDRNSDSSIG